METTLDPTTASPGGPAGAVKRDERHIGAGLRRAAVVLCATWSLGVALFAGYEIVTHRVGYFVALSLPVGTSVSGDQATLPDGRVVRLDHPIDIRNLPVGAIEWSDIPGVVELQPRAALLATVIGVPLAAWAALESLILLARWILRGFKSRSA